MANKIPGQKNRLPSDSSATASYSRRDLLRVGGIALPATALIPSWYPALSQVVDGFDFYISPSGSDTNPGTLSQPWSITAINSQRARYAGRRVGLLDGIYNVFPLFSRGPHDGYTALLQIAGGSAGSPTVIQAVNARKAIIQANNGSSYGDNDPILGTYGSSVPGYVTVDGIKLTGHVTKGFYFGDYGAASGGRRYPGITVKNCEFTGQSAIGQTYGNNLSSLELAGAVGALVQNNYFHNNTGYSANSSDHFTAWLCWFTESSVWEYNTLVASGTMYGKEIGNFGNEIRFNYVDASMMTNGGPEIAGIADYCDNRLIHHGVSQSWHHNVIKSAKGIDCRPGLGTGYINDVLNIYNNTLIVNNSGQSEGIIGRVSPGYLRCFNNIVVSAATGDQGLACWNVNVGGICDYNCYFSSPSLYVWNSYSSENAKVRDVINSLSAWRAALGSGADAHSVVGADPLFTATGTGPNYYALKGTSPARNSGRSDGTITGSACDMGAWGNGAPSRIGCSFLSSQPESPSLSVS